MKKKIRKKKARMKKNCVENMLRQQKLKILLKTRFAIKVITLNPKPKP